jgi:DNA polymerase-3 subunit epsilon
MGERHPVVAMNASYDLTLLNAELLRAGHRELSIDGPVLDPLVLDRMAEPRRRGKRRLPDLCARYQVAHTAAGPGEDASTAAGAHDATADTLAALRVLWRIGKTFPALAACTAEELHDAQIVGHREWAESFEAYLRSVGKGDVIDGTGRSDVRRCRHEAPSRRVVAADVPAALLLRLRQVDVPAHSHVAHPNRPGRSR